MIDRIPNPSSAKKGPDLMSGHHPSRMSKRTCPMRSLVTTLDPVPTPIPTRNLFLADVGTGPAFPAPPGRVSLPCTGPACRAPPGFASCGTGPAFAAPPGPVAALLSLGLVLVEQPDSTTSYVEPSSCTSASKFCVHFAWALWALLRLCVHSCQPLSWLNRW